MRTANHVDVDFFKVHMSEAELAKRFEDAVYHIEHQPYELNFVGKYALSELTRQHGYKVVLTGEPASLSANYELTLQVRDQTNTLPATRYISPTTCANRITAGKRTFSSRTMRSGPKPRKPWSTGSCRRIA